MQGPRHQHRRSSSMKEVQGRESCLPDPRSGPWLVFSAGRENGRNMCTFFSLSERRPYMRRMLGMRKDYSTWATPLGWLLMLDKFSGHCFLLNPNTMAKITLPPMNQGWKYRSCKCLLSSAPSEPDCVVMCFDYCHGYWRLIFCRPGDNKWVSYEYDQSHYVLIYDVAVSGGKFYAYTPGDNRFITTDSGLAATDSSLAVIELAPQPKLTRLAVEAPPEHRRELTYSYFNLLESYGELFLIRRHVLDDADEAAEIRVFKLVLPEQRWEAVDSLGDRVFFLEEDSCSASWSASESGKEGGCIYFVQENDNCLNAFDLDEGTLSPCVACPDDGATSSRPFLLMPAV